MSIKAPLFCAEVGSNHNGQIQRGLALVDRAASVGFGAVKFQMFRVDDLFSSEAQRVKPDLASRSRWELGFDNVEVLSERARQRGILFGVTPFSVEFVGRVAGHVDFLKIASYELLWDALLVECARTGLPIVLSTGMATEDEVAIAVEKLESSGCSDLTLLHCISNYPAGAADCNLSAMETMRNRTDCKVGWSDHTASPAVINRAVHRWSAAFVEMHLDLDGQGSEYDSGHCWLPDEAMQLICDYRIAVGADGHGRKEPAASEHLERAWRADPADGLRPRIEERKRLVSGSHTES